MNDETRMPSAEDTPIQLDEKQFNTEDRDDSAEDRDALLRDNISLVEAIAENFVGRGISRDNLVLAGYEGLLFAADAYPGGESRADQAFIDYASKWIRHYMRRFALKKMGLRAFINSYDMDFMGHEPISESEKDPALQVMHARLNNLLDLATNAERSILWVYIKQVCKRRGYKNAALFLNKDEVLALMDKEHVRDKEARAVLDEALNQVIYEDDPFFFWFDEKDSENNDVFEDD